MQNRILVVVLLMVLTQATKAQNETEPLFKKFGVSIGSNYTNMKFSHIYTTPITTGKIKPKPGIVVSFILHVPLQQKLSLQSEYAFSTRNAEVENSKANYSISYLSFPLLLKYQLTERLAIEAGAQGDLMIYSNRTTNGVSENLEHKTEERSVDAVAGLEYKVGKSFFVSGRYLRGFTHVGIESNSTEFIYEIGQLTVGLNF